MRRPDLNILDRALLYLAPGWALSRARARMAALYVFRNYDAASSSRRTAAWPRSGADANIALQGALVALRAHARDLVRNNGWARNGLRIIRNSHVGWGIIPKAVGAGGAPAKLNALWKKWVKECDAAGNTTFYGLQAQAIRAVAQDGEVLIRRRWRRATDQMTVPLQLQVLEADFIDSSRHGFLGQTGGPVIQGVEFDKVGRRTAYWLYEQHPGSGMIPSLTIASKRVPASEILHIYAVERPGQVRGVTWFAPVILTLKDFDEFEDAELMRQRIAACFSAFVTDPEGASTSLGGEDEVNGDSKVETLEPGAVTYLSPGREVQFATPPGITDSSFTTRQLRRAAAGLGVTYEDLTGDYLQVTFSSGRLGRLSFRASVDASRWDMLIPQLCDPAWTWFTEAAQVAGEIDAIEEPPSAEWTPPPLPMLEPDKEGLALQRLVRIGAMTPDEMVREQGYDPDDHWAELAAGLKRLQQLGIVLDIDASKVTQAGLAQPAPKGAGQSDSAEAAPEEPAASA